MTACQVAPHLKPKGCSTVPIIVSTNGTFEGIDIIPLELLLLCVFLPVFSYQVTH